MTETELLSIIRSHRDNSLGVEDGELSTERATALDHYHGRPYGNEVEGRSQVVSRDLAEAVDWALPGIMRVFMQAGVLAEFRPIGPDDEALAQQETDYVNLVMMQDNPGFMVLHDAVKDTLLLKNGYVKHWWEVEEKTTEETYTGISIDQLTMMFRDFEAKGAKVEIIGQESRVIPGMPPQNPAQQIMQPTMVELFDVRLKVTRKEGRVTWCAVPSEEVRVSKKCRGSLQESPFTEHVTKKTRSDLIEMGMPFAFVDKLTSVHETANSGQSYARDSVSEESEDAGIAVGDRSMDEIEYCEAYIRVDWDCDGVAELRRVVTCGDKIPPGEEWNQQIPAVALTGFAAKRVPHRHVGESLDDELADLQEIMTVLKRQLLDNIYLSNSSELVLNERANLRDFTTRIPGGLKRVRGDEAVQGAVMPLQVQPIINQILPVLDFFGQSKEQRTGISKATTGLDPDILQQTTKGAFMENLNRASQKMEMIARLLAETGVKESVLQVHGLLVRHQDSQRMVQLRGKWTPVNPQEWKQRNDLTVRVGLGTGNEEEKRQKLGMLAQMQGSLIQLMMNAPPPVYAKGYALFEDMAKTLGAEMPEKYAVAPNSPEYQQLQQMLAQQKQQPNPQMAKVQADAQAEQARLQLQGQMHAMEMRMQAQVDAHRQQVEAQQQQARMQMELELKRQEAAMDMQLERERAQMKAQVDLLIARINAEAKIDAAQLAAQNTLSMQQEMASDVAVGDSGMVQQTPPVDGGNEPM